MQKSPIKQIYLLLVIIGGFVSLSIYSTYALFTYEEIAGNVAKINTLSNLTIDTEINEYKRIKLMANSFVTIDIDINNSTSKDLCYGILYKTLGNYDNVYVYRSENNAIANGTMISGSNDRIPLVAINNNNIDVYINVGVNSSDIDNCVLNLKKDEKLITEIYEKRYLKDYLLLETEKDEIIKDSEYKEIKNYKVNLDNEELLVFSNYEFSDGIFNLINPKKINIKNIKDNEKYYFMLEDNNHEIYKIEGIEDLEVTTTKYVGFISSINGIVKYDNNYEYYGANPDNYICINNLDNNCELFRIIGLFSNGNNYNIKLVKNDYIGKFKYSETSNLMIADNVNSSIYNTLLDYYNNGLSNNTKDMLIEYEYKTDYNDRYDARLDNIYNYNSLNNYRLNVGLLSVTDYLYASNCNNKKWSEYDEDCYANDWLNKHDEEMLINRVDNDFENIYILSNGIKKRTYDTLLNIRPVVYLKDNILLIRGDGSINNPYIIR